MRIDFGVILSSGWLTINENKLMYIIHEYRDGHREANVSDANDWVWDDNDIAHDEAVDSIISRMKRDLRDYQYIDTSECEDSLYPF